MNAVVDFRSQGIQSIQELKHLIEFEHSIYPSANSSDIERVVSSWYLPAQTQNPTLQLAHRLARVLYANDDNRLLGYYMVLPLHESAYEDLLHGRLTELEIGPQHLVVDASKCSRIGLHVYHIEKFGKDKLGTGFSTLMLRSIGQVLREFSHIQVIGFSAYCVSASGIQLFMNTWNCYEIVSSDKNSEAEHIFIDKRTREVKVVSFSQAQSQSIYQKYAHLQYMHRCKMLVTRPDQFSPVWPYLRFNRSNL